MEDTPVRLDLNGKTRNLRHRNLVGKMCQHLKEMVGAGTGNEPQIDKADFNRLRNDYIADWRAIIASYPVGGALATQPDSARPEIDNPLTRDDWWYCQSPINIPGLAEGETQSMENLYWEELCIRTRKAIREITNSQSALYANCWHPSDPPRWNKYFDAIVYDMDTVIAKIEPTDEVLTRPQADPNFEVIGRELNTAGATNAPGHPMAD
jgi:hypothetical protein